MNPAIAGGVVLGHIFFCCQNYGKEDSTTAFVEGRGYGKHHINSLLYVAMTRAKNTLVMIESEYPERSALTIGNMKEYVNVR